MKNRFLFLGKSALFFISYFIIARFFFHLYMFKHTLNMGWSNFFLSYIHGLRLDGSITGYLMMFLALMMPVSMFLNNQWFRRIVDVFVGIFISIFSILVWADAVLYTNWGFRIDTSFFMYLKTPKDAMASVPVWELILFLVGWVIYSVFFIVLYRKFVSKNILKFNTSHWTAVFAFLLFGGCMILPVRGSVGIAPINTGMVYFSEDLYTNHSTVNAVWNFMYDLSHQDRTNLSVNFMDSQKAEDIRKNFVVQSDTVSKILNTQRPNVLIVILEGFASQIIEPLGGKPGVTPNISKIWNEGLGFNHFYASGSRSDRGLVAILSGYPSHPLASLMKYPKKTQKVNSLSHVLRDAGYSTSFYYGGDTDFANMNSFLKNSGFQRVVNQNDFSAEYRNSKWGVHDEYTFKRVMTDMDTAQAPFFKAFFTLSSHEPFDVPMKTVIEGSTDDEKYMNSAYYTDQCIGRFVDEAKSKDWWKNTLIIFVADHNVRYVEEYRIDEPRRYAIPMIWTGGALEKRGVVEEYGNQCDIATTLLLQLGLPFENFPYSRNLFANDGGGIMYHFNKGFGFISPQGHMIYDLNKNQVTESSGDTTLITTSKGLFQSMMEDFNKL